MKQKNIFSTVFVVFILLLCVVSCNVEASVLYSGTPVSNSGTDNTLNGSNTGRKVAVASNGVIYVAYHSPTLGVRVARSINEGRTFLPSVQLDTNDSDPDIEVDQNSVVYITWLSGTSVQFSRSVDGINFSTPTTVGTISALSVHMSVAIPYVYIIGRTGQTLLVNNNSGVGAFTSTSVDTFSRVYADVRVDPLTGYVYVQDDDPNVLYFVSTDHGQTFSAAHNPGYNIWYSTSAASFNSTNKYMYVNGGSASASLRINLNDNSIISTPFSDSDTSTTRALAADNVGNVISIRTIGGNVDYEISNDYGISTHSSGVVAAADFGSVAIDPLRHDVVIAYSTGGSVFVSVYQNELTTTTASIAAPTTITHSVAINPIIFFKPDISHISFTLNNGASTTASGVVPLQINTGSDIKSMAIANSSDFYGSGIMPLQTNSSWILCTDNCQSGKTYTVYLKLYTVYGQSITLSKDIVYQPVVQKVSVVKPSPKKSKKK